MNSESIPAVLSSASLPKEMKLIAEKVFQGDRITIEEGVALFYNAEIGFLGTLANYIREQKHGDKTFFNRNFHIEPTNMCVFDCKFCSYSRLLKQKDGAWELNEEEILDIIKKYDGQPVTEVHIVGGVHPKMGLKYFADLIKKIKEHRPDL